MKPTTRLSGWGRSSFINTQLRSVSTVKEMKDSFSNDGIIARGAGRSYGDIAVSENGSTISINKFNRLISFDEKTGILHCESGTTISDIIDVFASRGWFLPVVPGTRFVTMGGAISNDIHGKSHHNSGSFKNCIVAFNLLLTNGNQVKCSPTENSDFFNASFGGLGLIGLILDVTIQLKKIPSLFFNSITFPVRSLEEMMEVISEQDGLFSHSVAWINSEGKGRNLGMGTVTVGTEADPDELPQNTDPFIITTKKSLQYPSFLPFNLLNSGSSWFINQAISFKQNRVQGIVPFDSFLFPLDSVGNWNHIYGANGFFQIQFVVPEENGMKCLKATLHWLAEKGVKPYLNVLKKLGHGNGLLSFPFAGYTLAIDLAVSRKNIEIAHQLYQQVAQWDGRVYLAKDQFLEKSLFERMYPEHVIWRDIKEKADPHHLLKSAMSQRLSI